MESFRLISDVFESYEECESDHSPESGSWHFENVVLSRALGPLNKGDKVARLMYLLSPFHGGAIVCYATADDWANHTPTVSGDLSYVLSLDPE